MLQSALTENHFVRHAPTGILELSQEESGAHLGIVAGTVVVVAGNVECVAQSIQLVALEVIKFACSTQGAIVGNGGHFKPVEAQGTAYATHVECGIVGNQYGCCVQVRQYLTPHLWELWCMGSILWAYAVYLCVVVVVIVVGWLYEP